MTFQVFHYVFHNLWKSRCVKKEKGKKDFQFFAQNIKRRERSIKKIR